MSDTKSRLVAIGVAAAPAAAMLVARVFADEGARGLFQADAVALAVTATLAAFGARFDRRACAVLAGACVAVMAVHGVLGGGLAGALRLGALALGVGTAAGGLALLGLRLGAPRSTAGVIATSVPVLAMLGLFWADPVGDRLPAGERFAFKQAVLHLDAATAAAFGAAGFDRFHDTRVYQEVDLATEAVRAPDAVPTGLAWFILGLACAGAAALLPRRAEAEEPA